MGKELEWVKRSLPEPVRISGVPGPLERSFRPPWYSGGATEENGASRPLPGLAVMCAECRLQPTWFLELPKLRREASRGGDGAATLCVVTACVIALH